MAVKQKYHEVVEQDFGKFSSPMHQVWWQVEVSPIVRTELYPVWKAALVRNKVLTLGLILALLTLTANAVNLFWAFNRMSAPLSTRMIHNGAAVFTIVTWVSASFFLIARLRA